MAKRRMTKELAERLADEEAAYRFQGYDAWQAMFAERYKESLRSVLLDHVLAQMPDIDQNSPVLTGEAVE